MPSSYRELDMVYGRDQIRRRVQALGGKISRDYQAQLGASLAEKPPIAICILRGAVLFAADLLRAMDIPMEYDFIATSSYGDSTEPGAVKLIKDHDRPIGGRHVLIIDDIVDTGHTIAYTKRLLLARNPASLKICSLLDKRPRREVPVNIEYTGFVLHDDLFVVGYGLDYAERYRNLPYIAAFKRSARRGR